jgi:hypothetical protein
MLSGGPFDWALIVSLSERNKITRYKGKPMDALARYLSPIDLPLEQIYLDPNNPRFVGSDWQYVPDNDAIKDAPQLKAMQRLLEDFDVRKLKSNMEVNGFLPIDRIIVRKTSTTSYIILEGNRRICSAKLIKEYTDSGEKISPEVLETLKSIPVLEYTGENDNNEASWIFQGLRHITGLVDWSAFHKAKLLVEQMTRDSVSLTEVGRRFGLTPFGAGQWVRGYFAFAQAGEDTEYRDVIDERIYPYLQEIFGRSSIPVRVWLGWDDSEYKFKENANFNEFVGWFYPAEPSDDDENPIITKAAWERRFISKRDDIRQIAFLIHTSPKEWLSFRQDGDLEGAYSRAMLAKYEKENDENVNFAENLFSQISKCSSLISNTPIAVLKNEEMKKKLDDLINNLKESIKLVS